MMLAHLHCLGLNYRTASVADRERLAHLMPGDQASQPPWPELQEWVVLATCSRFEIYAVGEGVDVPLRRALAGETAPPQHYHYQAEAASHHLLRVAAGLDSLILGEPQILGQVRQAYQQARTAWASSGAATAPPSPTAQALSLLFDAALRAGKRARAETAISRGAANLSSAALAQAQKWVGPLRAASVVVIGAGEMARLALKALALRDVSRLALVNRSSNHTRETWEWFERYTGRPRGLSWTLAQLPQALLHADVILSAAAAPHFLLHPTLTALSQRDGRPLALIDLALPRTIDPAVRQLPGVQLLNVDQVQEEMNATLQERQHAIPQVEAILRAEQEALETQLHQLTLSPLLAAWRQQAEAIRQRELQRALRRLGPIDERTYQQLHHLSHALVNQLLHTPTQRLRQAEQTEAYLALITDLFGLGDNLAAARPLQDEHR